MAGYQASLIALFQRSQEKWEALFPSLGHEIFQSLTWWNLGAFLLVAVAAGVLHLGIHALIRSHVGQESPPTPGSATQAPRERPWFVIFWGAALSPLAVLVWIYGLYLAFTLLFLSLRRLEETPLVLHFLDWIRDFGFFAIFLWFLFRTIDGIDTRLRIRAKDSGNKWDRILSPLVGRTLRLVIPLVAIILGLPLFPITDEGVLFFRSGLSVLIILFIAVILSQTIHALEEGILANFRVDVDDNLQARKLHTQVTVLKKVAIVTIGIFALASILMVFEPLRRFGTSILASAGIAGIIIGFAAQRSLGTLLAGFQIAITQPIRLDDVVIVENEWGRIEEITLTYVVVRIWDLRRLVLPIDYFITKPFQNWTRTSADILGSIFLHVDYTVPIPALREELSRILEAAPKWDRKVNVLQVTEALERTLQLRILVSSKDAGTAWDLRCEVREKMIEFIRDQYPEALPRFRAEITTNSGGGDPGLLPTGA
jgi:small-conductance mechanosensitive channel